jgi:hypothetical protein
MLLLSMIYTTMKLTTRIIWCTYHKVPKPNFRVGIDGQSTWGPKLQVLLMLGSPAHGGKVSTFEPQKVIKIL